MRLLEEFLQRIETKLAAIEHFKDANCHRFDMFRGLNKLKDPKLLSEGYCRTCCLPLAKHVPHDPDEPKKPEGPAGPAEWRPFLHAQSKLYRSGLGPLTDIELARLPLPISKRRLLDMAAEVKERLERQPKAPSRYDRIAADDDEDFP